MSLSFALSEATPNGPTGDNGTGPELGDCELSAFCEIIQMSSANVAEELLRFRDGKGLVLEINLALKLVHM
jgi:hypothetical protein